MVTGLTEVQPCFFLNRELIQHKRYRQKGILTAFMPYTFIPYTLSLYTLYPIPLYLIPFIHPL
jgi:hypothetical protein